MISLTTQGNWDFTEKVRGIESQGAINKKRVSIIRLARTLSTTMSAQRCCQKSLIARRMSTYIPGHQDRNHWAGEDALLCNLYQAYYS
ncbi:hypothetical protein EYC84_006707 [Monilinia fructicola]|uniref:Uncharacterized protein n=1 Tax=Monilinia fructicola TaxID=38448 RepID=A0A5M9K6R3_MONFR|nr:hypothetical protein EYC84_006707 [Monilinia fructicola]